MKLIELISRADFAKMIDWMPKPEKGEKLREFTIKSCKIAKKYNLGAIVVPFEYVSLAAELLEGTDVKVSVGIGPDVVSDETMLDVKAFGRMPTEKKIDLVRRAIRDGAHEVEFWINVDALKNDDYDLVRQDLEAVVRAAKSERSDVVVKVLLETGYLTDEEIVRASKIVKKAGADFVKTGTGYGTRGATVHDVELIRRAVGRLMGVKAAGGIHTFDEALTMIKAGANRIGASRAIDLIEGIK